MYKCCYFSSNKMWVVYYWHYEQWLELRRFAHPELAEQYVIDCMNFCGFNGIKKFQISCEIVEIVGAPTNDLNDNDSDSDML